MLPKLCPECLSVGLFFLGGGGEGGRGAMYLNMDAASQIHNCLVFLG